MKTKQLPQAVDFERAVVGGLLLEAGAFHNLEVVLKPDDFYESAHQHIFQAMQNLAAQQKPVDMLTVTEELSRMKKLEVCGGPFYISQLTSNIASTSHLDYHARIVKQKAYARRIILMGNQMVQDAHDPSLDILDVVETFEKNFTALNCDQSQAEVLTMEQILRRTILHAGEMEQLKNQGEYTAIPTGLPKLDKILNGGLHGGDLAVVAARPSMGKTQFALLFAKTAAQVGKQVCICSIEMTARQLVTRYLLEDTRISPSHLREGKMTATEWDALNETAAKLWDLPIHIAADPSIRYLSNIRREARRLKRQGLLDMLIIDYLGLIRTSLSFQNRYQEVGYITSELKSLAKELNIPIVLLCQLSRPPKGYTTDRKPQIDDLRESGDIEQDADIVTIIHKKGFNDPNAMDVNGKPLKNRGILIIGKNREGERGKEIPFEHDDRYKNIWEA